MRKVKNSIKKMMALCLAAIMTLAMATTAFAAETHQGNLTVNVNEGNTLKGQTIKLYKLFDLTVSGEHYAYTVNEKYKSILKDLLKLNDQSTNEEYYNAVAGKDKEIQQFANDFTKKVLEASIVAEETADISDDAKTHVFNNLDYGYYLVYQTGTKEIQSALVSVADASTSAVTLKGQAPSIEKTANKPTVEIGQVVTYQVKGVIPDTTGYAEYTYKIHDKLTDGLDFVEDENGTAPQGNSYKVSIQIEGESLENQTATLSGNGNRTMELDLSQWVRDNQAAHKGKNFTVTYYAKVNASAVVETKNSASLEYGNTPTSTTTTTPSEAKTPTYPLQIHKFDRKDNNGYLADATFRLYRNETDAKGDKNPIAVTGSDGAYTVAEDQANTHTYDMVSVGTALSMGMNLKLNGLAAGDYWLVETKAPEGYNGVTAPIKITITKSVDGDENNWKISRGDGVTVADKIIDIENTTGAMLPETGGMGTVLFTVVGIVLILGVAVSFVISRRKHTK